MLETIRKTTKSKYILLLFGAIILVFVFWGIGPGGRGKSANAVAMVNGEPIEIKDYLALHKRLTDYYRGVLKDKYTPAVEKSLNLKQNAVSILIDRRLAVMAAEDKGIKVSKKEVQETIASMTAFQENGVFNQERYFSALRSERLKPGEFEDDVRNDLLVERVRAQVVKGVTVSDEDVKKAFLRENRRIDLAYVYVDASDKRADVKVTDKEGKEYLMDHSTDFVLPAELKAVYAYADFAAFKKRARISDKEITEYYEKNKSRFMEPEQIHARHILIRVDMGAGNRAASQKAAVKKARGILKRVKAGEDFAALAKKYSGDPGSAKKGGDLGWFPKGVMMKSFEDAAFALKPGEVSGIVETPFGAHIIRLEGRRAGKLKSLAEARVSIKAELSTDLSNEKALKAIKSLGETFKKTKDVKELRQAVKKAGGLVFYETKLFRARNFDESLAKVGRLRDSLFLMSDGEVSEPVKTYNGIYLVKIVKRIDARIPEYDEVKDDVIEVLTAKKALRAAKKEAANVLNELKDGKKLKDVAKAKGLKQGSTGQFSSSTRLIPGLGIPVSSFGGLFDLTVAKPLYQKPIVAGGKFFIVELKDSEEADLAELTPDVRQSLSEMLKSNKEEKKINDWLVSLRKKTQIQVFEDRM